MKATINAIRNVLNRKPKLKKSIKIISIIFLVFILLYIIVPLPDPPFENNYSTVVTDENGEILRAFLNNDQQWHFPPQKDLPVPGKLKQAVLQYEDRYFYQHPGVNPVSLVRALVRNISAGEVKSGASTLSMQVIRLAFKRKRTVLNKFLEILQALKLEMNYSKEDIFKMYIDHAPYGGNIIGYYAASMKYFNRPPHQLTWGQAATLAVLPNAPGLISPLMNREHLIKKRNGLLESLMKEGIIDAETCAASIVEPVRGEAESFFLNAPHLARALKSRYGMESRFIRTTILKEYQVSVERMMRAHLSYLGAMGIRNGAALVVETGTGRVRVYVGSQGFFDRGSGGQVDGVVAPRSSGSILKPFLYALSMDEGLILPSTVIRDVPSYFGAFSPSNADRRYGGLVTAKEALIRSLNVPAVRLLNAYGLYKFYVFLKSAGVSTIFREPDDYGLTLVLGGAETTLYDLAMLYCGLGRGGVFSRLRIFPGGGDVDGGVRLFSEGASWLTLNILKELKRPGAEFYWEQYRNQFPIAWKTGTSYGQRDGWAVGVSPSWTIAVWVGNFDGEGNSNISGARCAAPLMFDIFNFLPKSYEESWFRRPVGDLVPVTLCMDTGFLAGPDCERTFVVDSPGVKGALRRCPYHRGIYVTTGVGEKYEVCSLCWEPGKYRREVRLIYPPDVTQYLRESGVVVSEVPVHRGDCMGLDEGNPIQVIYPVSGARLWIPREFGGGLQGVTFTVAHRVLGRRLFWYIDDIYRGVTEGRHKMAFQLSVGSHWLEVVDGEGNRAKRRFSILYRQKEAP